MKWGLSNVGLDTAQADAMSDADLGLLNDSYMGQTGGVHGDGVFGPAPTDLAVVPNELGTADPEASLEDEDEDEFANCPSRAPGTRPGRGTGTLAIGGPLR